MEKYGYDNLDLPATLSEEYIERRWRELQSDTNMLNKWWTALEVKFHTKQQIKFIEAQREKLEAVGRFARAKADTYRAGTDARNAETDFHVAGKPEYQGLRAEREILGVKIEVAEYGARIREAEARGRPPEKAAGKEEEKKKPTPEEWIARLAKVINQQVGDITRIDSLVAEHFTALADKEKGEKELVDTNPLLSPEEKAERKREINARYRNLRDDINRLVNVIRSESKKRRS